MNALDATALGLLLTVGFGLIGIAALVARTGWQHRHNRIFAALYLASGLNSVAQGVYPFAADFHAHSPLFPGDVVWFVIQVVCTVVMLPLLFIFVLNFPRPAPWIMTRPHLQWAAFSVSLLFGYMFLTQPPTSPVFVLAQQSFNLLATGVIFAATFLLWRTEERSPSDIERRQAGYLLLGFMPAFAATGAITLLGYALPPGQAALSQGFLGSFIDPPLELIAAAVTAFAILKYRILEFELKVRGGMRYALLTVIIGSVFFVVEVYVGNFILQNQVFSFLGQYGSAGVAGIASIVLFKPVQSVSGKVADRLFPDAAASKGDYDQQRSREIYQAQATHVLRDGKVTDREMEFLHTLRDQLGLTDMEAQAIEEAVERSLGVDSDRTGLQRLRTEAPPLPQWSGEQPGGAPSSPAGMARALPAARILTVPGLAAGEPDALEASPRPADTGQPRAPKRKTSTGAGSRTPSKPAPAKSTPRAAAKPAAARTTAKPAARKPAASKSSNSKGPPP